MGSLGARRTPSPATRSLVSTDYAHSGTYSLKFHYQGRADGQDGWAEQRFAVAPDGTTAPSEIWLDYYIRFPSNFAYRTQTSSTNNKLLYIWSETYGGAGDQQVGIEYNHDSGGADWIHAEPNSYARDFKRR